MPTTEPGSAICRMSTAGGAVATVLRPAPPPRGGKADAALHQPDFGPDGSIVFEADWTAEQAWRLRPGSRTPTRISRATNDNSPCVLPDGRVATLWLGRRGNRNGLHELRVAGPTGACFRMLVTGIDIADIGLGCGR